MEQRKRKPRVVLVHLMDPLRPAQGGAIRYTMYLLEYLLERGYEVTFLAAQDLGRYPVALRTYEGYRNGKLKIVYLTAGGSMAHYLAKLAFYIPRMKIEEKTIVHLQRTLYIVPFILAGRKRRLLRLVVTVHAKPLETFRAKHSLAYRVLKPLYTAFERLLFRFVDAIIFGTKELMDEYRLPAELHARSIVLATGLVDPGLFSPLPEDQKAKARRAIGLSSSDLVLLFVGRLEKVKRVDLLLLALKELLSRGVENAKLLVVGGGSEEEALRKMAEELGIADKVLFTGYVEPTRVSLYYQVSDILVLPSITEVSPNVIKEAISCGVPFVATASSQEIIALWKRGAGLVVPVDVDPTELAEAIKKLYRRLGEYKKRLQSIAREYDKNSVMSLVEALYEILSSH